MPHEQLQRALATLMTDEEYRGAIASDPDRLATEFGVSAADLEILTFAGGADGGASHTASGPGRVGPRADLRVGSGVTARVGTCVMTRAPGHPKRA